MKNTLKVHTFGVDELKSAEIKSIDGGYWFLIPLGIYLYDNRAQFLQGVYDGIKDFR
jgi:hypothetical protein